MRIAVVAVLVMLPRLADAAPCTYDRNRPEIVGQRGFSDALRCNGQKVEDVTISVGSDGSIVGVGWNEYQGAHLSRSTTLHASGLISYSVYDDSIQGTYSQKSRMVLQYVFPRRHRYTIDRTQGLLTVRDQSGHAWQLVPIKLPEAGMRKVSYLVSSIAKANQSTVPIDLSSRRGVVGIDLAATPVMWMHHERLSMGGFDDTRSVRYKKLKSTFHDGKGGTCAVENGELFVPSPNDPNDKYDDIFKFTDDAQLADFLAKACPKLDLAALR
jgi:hypothetical protein